MTYVGNYSAEDDDGILKIFDRLRRLKARADAYESQTLEIGTHFSHAFFVLGVTAVILNLTVLLIIFIRKRCTFTNVFYMLLIDFTIVDCLTALCLITYAVSVIKGGDGYENDFLTNFKVEQIMNFILRFCHLKTILNLLMLTLNEFVFMKYPLRYHIIITRKSALFMICASWTACVALTAASTFVRGRRARVFVNFNVTDMELNTNGATKVETNMNLSNFYMQRIDESSQETQIHYAVSVILTSFCMVGLTVVIVCYTIFFRIVKRIMNTDANLIKGANRQPSDYSWSSDAASMDDSLRIRFGTTSTLSGTRGSFTDDRRIKRQLVRRYKYVIVIGLVIFVYMPYLMSYSTIQIFQYIIILRRSRQTTLTSRTDRNIFIIRWSMQLLVGLHSLFQPLCCFRMKEFRSFFTNSTLCQCHKNDSSQYYKSTLGYYRKNSSVYSKKRDMVASSMKMTSTHRTPFKSSSVNEKDNDEADNGNKSFTTPHHNKRGKRISFAKGEKNFEDGSSLFKREQVICGSTSTAETNPTGDRTNLTKTIKKQKANDNVLNIELF